MADKPAIEQKSRITPVYQLKDKTPVNYGTSGKRKALPKFIRDVIDYHNGSIPLENKKIVTVPDANLPLGDRSIIPGPQSPICAACKLDQTGCQHPYLNYAGSKNPVATILLDSIGHQEDKYGGIGRGERSITNYLIGQINQMFKKHGVSIKDIRWVPITRCANRSGKKVNYRTKGKWCRHYAVRELMLHPPRVVIPVGTAVLGLLSHKSNAGDWSGRLLTWRGWPDDWLTNPDFVLDRPDPINPEKTVRGHPLYGPVPDIRIPMVPLQHPNLVLVHQNDVITQAWLKNLVYALQVGKQDIPSPNYDRPWYHISEDPQEIITILEEVIRLADTYKENFIVSYDTETGGLKQWKYYRRAEPSNTIADRHPSTNIADRSAVARKAGIADDSIKAQDSQEFKTVKEGDPRIVFMMFRWTNPETSQPQSIGFPWDFATSSLKPHLNDIAPYVIKVLSKAQIAGHNLTFDELFTIATVGCKPDEHEPFKPDGTWNENWLALQRRINQLCDAAKWDTWHMAFTCLQKRGSLGLEILAYDYVRDLAGYEEEMTLLIDLHGDEMNPANGKGGHYANCPREMWQTHLRPYVMGDVEVTYQARDRLAAKLERSKLFKIPLALPGSPGYFRDYVCPSRNVAYQKIVSPASQTLTKMMARGMYIDPQELEDQERMYPQKVEDARKRLHTTDPAIEVWYKQKKEEAEKAVDAKEEGAEPWELDLENKGQLKELLFKILGCKVIRLTKNGRALYGDNQAEWESLGLTPEQKLAYAAVDKYTLNQLAVKHENLRPLQEYRKLFKLYNTYVRPMRNMMSSLDKKHRIKEPHLCIDQCIHPSFLIAGTRSGRTSARDPNVQQIPNEGIIKRLFTSRFKDRGCIYSADMSQIELRLMACASGDPAMVQAYLDNIDIHSSTASKIYKLPYETFTKDHMEKLQKEGKGDKAKSLELKRKIAKTANFLTGYGGGPFGLQNVLANAEVYLPIEECENIIAAFFEVYPVLKLFLGVYKNFVWENGVAVSLFGRVRQFQEVYGEDREASSKALRAGCNHIIQSTASDILLICLFTIEALMRDAGLNSMLISTVHDSLVIDALREELPSVHEIVNWVTNNLSQVLAFVLPGYDSSWIVCPITSDSEIGINYLDTNKISGNNPDWDKLLQPKKH